MCHEKSFICTKDVSYSIVIAFLAQYCTDLVCFVAMTAGKNLKGIDRVYFI